MKALEDKIAALKRASNPNAIKTIWEESIRSMEADILDLLEQQHEASEDGDGNDLGMYAESTKEAKEIKGTWRGWDIKLIDDADPYGKHWREMWFIRFEDNTMIIDEDKIHQEEGGLLTDYLTGRDGKWPKGREAAMHLNKEYRDDVIEAVKAIMVSKLMKLQ